jgi:hypothetical protein
LALGTFWYSTTLAGRWLEITQRVQKSTFSGSP